MVMNYRARIIGAVYYLIFGLIAAATPCLRANNQSDLTQRIRQLMEQYASVQTVSMVAHVHTILYRGVLPDSTETTPLIYNVYFSFTAAHEKYNVINIDDWKAPTEYSRARYTYDGQRAELLSMVGQDLSFTKKDYDTQVYTTSNPFFYPICFLDLSTDKYTRVLKLPYVQSPATLHALLANIKPDPASANGSEVVGILPRAGILWGHPYEYRIVFGGKISYLPTRIEEILLDKNNPAIPTKPVFNKRIDILDYGSEMVDGKPFYWAKTIQVTWYHDGTLFQVENINAESCQVNQPVDQNDFSIDFKLAQRITDWDTGAFMQVRTGVHPPPVVTGIANDTNEMDLPVPTDAPRQSNATTAGKMQTNNTSLMAIGPEAKTTDDLASVSNATAVDSSSLTGWLAVGAAILLLLGVQMRMRIIRSRAQAG